MGKVVAAVELFHTADKDGNGKLDLNEFTDLMRKSVEASDIYENDEEKKQILEIIVGFSEMKLNDYDENNDKFLQKEEFIKWCVENIKAIDEIKKITKLLK